MNNMKRFASLLLALVMVLAMAAPAMAATVTVTNTTQNHTYKAYQIFSGTQAADAGDDAPLGDVAWGDGVDSETLMAALKGDTRFNITTTETVEGVETSVTKNIFTACSTAADVSIVLSEYNDNDAVVKAFANVVAANLKGEGTVINESTTELATGYYLIVDTSALTGEGAVDAHNSALLQVTKDIAITNKYTVPEPDKDITKVDETVYENGVEGADANIGDEIEFTITGTLPSNYDDYESYKYVFHDTLSAGLTFKNGSVKVYVVNGEQETNITDKFTVTNAACTKTDCGCNLQVSCDNLKQVENVSATSVIKVVYVATLNENAKIGDEGNKNDVYIEYSSNPNYDGDGTPPTNDTPKDEVLVFTYELDVTKVDEDDQETKLKDAEFVLYREITVTGETSEEETKTIPEYVIVDDNSEVTGWTTVKTEASVLKSGEDGTFKIVGLDAGTYYLEETKAPAGYNLLTEAIKIEILATVNQSEESGAALQDLDIKVNDGTAEDSDIDKGTVSTTVLNNAGKVLPETGGMGTTLFYAVGGLLVAGAVVVLMMKKRNAA